jgi:hypothetical protein
MIRRASGHMAAVHACVAMHEFTITRAAYLVHARRAPGSRYGGASRRVWEWVRTGAAEHLRVQDGEHVIRFLPWVAEAIKAGRIAP